MRLNRKEKNEFRNRVEEAVNSNWNEIPDASIKIDTSLLEELIFQTEHIWYGGKQVTIKFPIWTGPFLRKFDLTSVSFDDVLWNKKAFQTICNVSLEIDENQDCDLSYTNAKIDFRKAF